MSNFIIYLAIFCFIHIQIYAQSQDKLPADCGCPLALEQSIDKVTRIYAGFDDKVTRETKPAYEKLLIDLRKAAQNTDSEKECYEILKQYIAFFKDRHVAVFPDWEVNTRQEEIKNMKVEFKQINNEFLYAKLPIFNIKEVETLDSLLMANKELITKTPYLIFDFRGNGGGDASATDEMVKLIYTNPIVYPEWQYRFSKEYISLMESWIEAEKDTTNFKYFPSKTLLEEMKKNPGQFAGYTGDYKITHEIDIDKKTKKVAFLIDKECGSSTEFFVYTGKQSKKVTLFGTNTQGVMDYGDVQNFVICKNKFYVGIATAKNGWTKDFHIDNIGFEPDVRITPEDGDWVEFVMKYYKERE